MVRTATSKPKRPKAVKTVAIPRPDKLRGPGSDPENPYVLLEKVRVHHPHLAEAQICLAWQRDVKPDKDGRVWIVKARKVNELGRDRTQDDFEIIINQTLWYRWQKKQHLGLLDDGLCRCGISLDRDGEDIKDEKKRIVYRTIKPDVVTFNAVIERHGFYNGSLSDMARAVGKKLEEGEPLWEFAQDGAATIPFGTVNPKASPGVNGHAPKDDGWMDAVLIEVLTLPAAIQTAFADANLRTMGELAEFTARKRLTDIPGLGEAKAAKVEDQLEKFWENQKATAGAK